MKGKLFKVKIIILLLIIGLLLLFVMGALLIPYPYSQFFEKEAGGKGGPTTIDTRYMSEITGIDSPEEMQRQYERHSNDYKFPLDEEFGVMLAYPDPNIRWIGMVFIHHFPSLSELALDYEGNVIYENITMPEVQASMDGFLNDPNLISRLQNQMNEIWALNDPGKGVLDLVDWLKAPGFDVKFMGGRPQTLFDASMYLVRINDQDIYLFEFKDQATRATVSNHISPDGTEITQQEGDITVTTHIEYLDQPNLWAKGNLLVQYLGKDQVIIGALNTKLGEPLTTHSILTDEPSPPVCTPPACAPDEMYHCPGECSGGCGTTCATATPGASPGSGWVWGKICFPAETIPEMELYFQEINTQQTLVFSILEDQDSYQFEIPAGVYLAFTRLPNKDAGGGYTQFIECNQNISACTDHSLARFLVQENHVTVGVDICDWEGNPGLFPAVPEEWNKNK